jgi:hypothetical protein
VTFTAWVSCLIHFLPFEGHYLHDWGHFTKYSNEWKITSMKLQEPFSIHGTVALKSRESVVWCHIFSKLRALTTDDDNIKKGFKESTTYFKALSKHIYSVNDNPPTGSERQCYYSCFYCHMQSYISAIQPHNLFFSYLWPKRYALSR